VQLPELKRSLYLKVLGGAGKYGGAGKRFRRLNQQDIIFNINYLRDQAMAGAPGCPDGHFGMMVAYFLFVVKEHL
jgi:hypothetical protein